MKITGPLNRMSNNPHNIEDLLVEYRRHKTLSNILMYAVWPMGALVTHVVGGGGGGGLLTHFFSL